MASKTKSILVIGLTKPPTEERAEAAGVPAELIEQKIKEEAQRVRDAGYELLPMLYSPEKLAVALEEIEQKLKSQKWDGFMIGNGIRGADLLTPVFEQLVNMSREVAPKTKLLFSVVLTDLYEQIRRNFE